MRALIGLGANLGDRIAQLRSAVTGLAAADEVSVLAVSGIYESAPVGGPAQPDFANAVALIETSLAPALLLELLHAIEHAHGRVRDEHWGPRTLDLDLVDFEGFVSLDPDLTVPHPLATQRAFVLLPASEIAADWPLAGRPISQWVAELPADAGLRLLSEAVG